MKIEITKEELEWICDGLGCRQSEWDDVPKEIIKKFRNLLDEWTEDDDETDYPYCGMKDLRLLQNEYNKRMSKALQMEDDDD